MSAWQGSTRRHRLPPDWPKIRKRILRRDGHVCQTRDDRYRICGRPATEVDHKRPGDDHSDGNLEAICEWHHARKSSREGNAAKAKNRREIASRFRTSENHPGIL